MGVVGVAATPSLAFGGGLQLVERLGEDVRVAARIAFRLLFVCYL